MKVQICTGAKCMFYGADNIIDRVLDLNENLSDYPGVPADARLDIEITPCNDHCKGKGRHVSPVVYVDGEIIEKASSSALMERILNTLQEGQDNA